MIKFREHVAFYTFRLRADFPCSNRAEARTLSDFPFSNTHTHTPIGSLALPDEDRGRSSYQGASKGQVFVRKQCLPRANETCDAMMPVHEGRSEMKNRTRAILVFSEKMDFVKLKIVGTRITTEFPSKFQERRWQA